MDLLDQKETQVQKEIWDLKDLLVLLDLGDHRDSPEIRDLREQLEQKVTKEVQGLREMMEIEVSKETKATQDQEVYKGLRDHKGLKD